MNERKIDDSVAAGAFWHLVEHLQHRTDAANVDLMGLGGFCRNCLADWLQEAAQQHSETLDEEAARSAIYGMPYAEWKACHQQPASPEQLARMEESVARNKRSG